MTRLVVAMRLYCALSLWAVLPEFSSAADRPQWGQLHSRNMISQEKNLPQWFEPGERDTDTGEIDLATTENVKWVTRLGSRTYCSPVIAQGKVFLGTNNDAPRDPRIVGDRGVLMCLDESTGKFLWQLTVPKIDWIRFFDAPKSGVTSTPTVDDGRLYVVTNRGEVMCLDMEGMADGNDGPYTAEGQHMALPDQPPREPGRNDADILWCYDMVAELGVRIHDSSNSSVLIHGDVLYVGTANGLNEEHDNVAKPDAPTLIALSKHTGELVARDSFGVGSDVVHGQWSSPAMGRVGDTDCVFFGAGNGRVYACEALSAAGNGIRRLQPLWSFNGQPDARLGDSLPFQCGRGSPSYSVVATPVFRKNRVYVAFTHDPWVGKDDGWLACIDATNSGDVTRSGLVWSYDGISDCLSTVSIADNLLFIADYAGRLHCLDAETGQRYWMEELGGRIWGSTLLADGKVYVGTDRCEFWVFEAAKDAKVISRIRMRDQIFTTPVAANGVLYVATAKHLYALGGNRNNGN
ncbi:MAG: PQQ-binding-like beta-propeller repeat protein [Pirellulaceae bacterium]|nr:PQQ-binding-like beta-propeller repeat protein [Pirellulaceae bacterium]